MVDVYPLFFFPCFFIFSSFAMIKTQKEKSYRNILDAVVLFGKQTPAQAIRKRKKKKLILAFLRRLNHNGHNETADP